nr:PREDICTED: geranylgeranyl transferase type-2 subunit alpha [Bemisia tabaci]
MHGRVKTRTTEEQRELQRIEKQKKVKLYLEGMNKAFEKRNKKELDDEALAICENLLVHNPDILTLWNFRKEILLEFKNSACTNPEIDLEKLVSKELYLTEVCLKVNPKSYCAWHQRCWTLDNIAPKPDWDRELLVCTKYLELDERNFHTWDYRKFVVGRAGVSAKSELEYTTSKINRNFSNYSSWHYRSQYLPLVHPDATGERPIDRDIHIKELTLVESAAFTDPNDQSGWFYQRWLLDLQQQLPLVLTQACISENFTWVAFNKPVCPNDTALSITGLGDGKWKTCNGETASHVWIKDTQDQSLISYEQSKLSLFVNGELKSDLELKLVTESNDQQKMIGFRKPSFINNLNSALVDFYSSLLESVISLLELEPDCKWPLLSFVTIARHLRFESSRAEIYEKLELLKKCDPTRKNYYDDLRSKFLIEDKLSELEDFTGVFDVSCMELTALYHTQYLSLFREVNLSKNKLGKIKRRCLGNLCNLQACEVLNISDNNLEVTKVPKLPNLVTLVDGKCLAGQKV